MSLFGLSDGSVSLSISGGTPDIQKIGEVLIHLHPAKHTTIPLQMLIHVFIQIQSL